MTTRSSEKGFSESQALPERVAKLEREHAELAERLARLETASGSVVDPDRGVPDSSPPEPPGAFEEEETAPPLTLPRLPEGSVALAGRTLMAVGGGFLFRALTEAGTPNVAQIQQGGPITGHTGEYPVRSATRGDFKPTDRAAHRMTLIGVDPGSKNDVGRPLHELDQLIRTAPHPDHHQPIHA